MSTSIAIIRTEQCVVIAADSAAVDEAGNPAAPECKIRQIGKFVYVPNKLTEDSASQYNLHHIVENVGERESLGDLAEALREAIPEPLIRSLIAARQRNPARFRENFEAPPPQALGIALAGIDGGRPSLVDLRFFIKDLEAETIGLRIEEHRCPGAGCPKGTALVLAGPKDLKERFAAKYPNYWTASTDSLAKNAEAFVQMAIDARLPDVGPPISVLVISPNGLEWRKGKPRHKEPPKQ
jgi:hypothetical protein